MCMLRDSFKCLASVHRVISKALTRCPIKAFLEKFPEESRPSPAPLTTHAEQRRDRCRLQVLSTRIPIEP